MAAPVGNLANAPITIKPVILGGKSTIEIATMIGKNQAQAKVLKQNQADNSADKHPSVMVTLNKTDLPVTVEGFSSGSTEYTLSVIGVLCIVYGIVAK
jgi:hypothetical protein